MSTKKSATAEDKKKAVMYLSFRGRYHGFIWAENSEVSNENRRAIPSEKAQNTGRLSPCQLQHNLSHRDHERNK